MADVSEEQNNSASKTILRVKRKRSEDPADILLVSHAFKKSFREENLHPDCTSNSVQRIFRLAGTVSKSDENLLSPEVLDKLKGNDRHKSKMKTNLHNDLTLESINEKLRETKKLSSQKSRYKVISKHREPEEESRKPQENEDTSADVIKEEMFRLYKLYDIVLDEVEHGKMCEKTAKAEEDPNAILCNSVKMIREKLNINEPTKKLELLEKDYVYDVYCAEDNYGGLSEVLDIIHLNQSELVSDAYEDPEHYDDEDDSNDENNWRNDYPDEDEWSQSSNEEFRYKSDTFDYRWEDPDRYGRGYDGKMFSDNLSSDEDQEYPHFGKKFDEYGDDKEEYSFEVVDEDD